MKKIAEYFDLRFFIKFLLLFFCLYYFNQFYIGITAAGGKFYSPFLEHQLNYVAWIRGAVLEASNALANLLGVHAHIVPPYKLKLLNGLSVKMGYTCIGLENISFWLAFVISHSGGFAKKMIACVTGVLVICFINSLRVTLLLIALKTDVNINRFADHHTWYNIIAYALIGTMIYFFTKYSGEQNKTLATAM